MIFKVFYQKDFSQIPVRENTDTMFVEAETEREVRRKLADRNYNIEFIQPVSEGLLKHEQKKEDFKVENL
ncbi:DNA-dependent RNA polymerase subunit epsilon [Salibacterium halotolerans]|uniref:DNA-directed RNA polymerase subunit epsilon n=1 Tax=Salibacterium halotolerans TaxID=1884432 RepID=A0A1I5LY89_9BACI|nr:DNA-directed RNA polymerase subunit epsilon [Salibacterium halotolerans]SFP02133.1 DNA-dependent RNA polymerase auxiliary subunit epsilon [Salibacterium halotolerans]